MFYRWWQCYFKHQSDRIDPDTLLPELILAFHTVQKKLKKNKGTQIREIQAVQNFFQTIYDPLHLKRTVHYAAKTLKDKIHDKIPSMSFPPFTLVNIFLHFILKRGFLFCQLVRWPWPLGHPIPNVYFVIV